MKLFNALIKKFSKATSFEVAEIYEAFEELEVSLDKARNDINLDKVVRIGANRALFILGKYYNKLDDCEVYSVATSKYFSVVRVTIIISFLNHYSRSPHTNENIPLVQEEYWVARGMEADAS